MIATPAASSIVRREALPDARMIDSVEIAISFKNAMLQLK